MWLLSQNGNTPPRQSAIVRYWFAILATDQLPTSSQDRREASVLKMKWHCDVCQVENVCEVPRETHFLGVILMAKRDHESISPFCGWVKIQGSLLHPPNRQISN